jgi:hypothetical protein
MYQLFCASLTIVSDVLSFNIALAEVIATLKNGIASVNVTKGEASQFDISSSHIVPTELFICLYSHLSFILTVKYVIVFQVV